MAAYGAVSSYLRTHLYVALNKEKITRCSSASKNLPRIGMALLSTHAKFRPFAASDSSSPSCIFKDSLKLNDSYKHYDQLTANFAAAANLPFMFLQLPQIVLNASNLLKGNKSALLAVPWLGMLTGLLGNISLLSYFAKKKEKEALLIQALGAVSTYIVISQLAIAEAMPLQHFIFTSVLVVSSLILNFLFLFNRVGAKMWCLWEDFITIAALSALPQVIWSTFIPFIPASILPGLFALSAAIAVVIMARMSMLSKQNMELLSSASGWSATLLFMWMPISQLWANFLNPSNVKGLSALSILLTLIGNSLTIPRGLFIRDFMWFLGSSWASIFYGLGNLMCMSYCGSICNESSIAALTVFCTWIGWSFWMDAKAHGYSSPAESLRVLVFGF